jgi:hypothetical protein
VSQPWLKFYPRDWRGDQALRVVSLAARGLWIEMLCIMHEASPRGHLLIGASAVTDAALARAVGTRTEEVQALLVELHDAGVFDRSRKGVILSRRMIADERRSKVGRDAKLQAIEDAKKNTAPSRSATSPPPTQKPESRGKDKGHQGPLSLPEAKNEFLGPKEVRDAFAAKLGEEWCVSYLDRCTWQDVPERALIPATKHAGEKLVRDARKILAALGLSVLERAA